MENDSAKTIKEQWGIDPLEGVTLNEVQQTIVDEALGNAESMRTEKPVGMDLENKYKGSFGQCDSLIGGLGPDLKKQLLRNVYINENNLYFLILHLKLSSLFYSTQLSDMFAYETPNNTNVNNRESTDKVALVNNSILVYNFHSVMFQQRFFIFVILNSKQNINKNSTS